MAVSGAIGICQAQTTDLKKLGDLPPILKESSALEVSPAGNLWTIVDSNYPVLYCLDQNGAITRAIHLNNKNHGWEDLTQDDDGNFYIGDFGNNDNKRDNLKIYKIPSPDTIKRKIVTADIIEFRYSDQHEFPPPFTRKNFDMDAMVWFDHSIYLFSKNRTKPFSGYTKMYRLPDQPGKQVAQLVDSVNLGPGHMLNTWVTSADISPDKKTLALLTHDKIWLFSCFKGSNFFKGTKKTILLNHFSQKEGISFSDNETLFITDERTKDLLGGCLYTLKLSESDRKRCD